MTRDECATFVRHLCARTGRKADALTLDIWLDDLQHVPLDVALAALKAACLKPDHGWIDSAVVLQEVRAITRNRLQQVSTEELMADVDPQDPHWVRILQQRRAVIAQGGTIPPTLKVVHSA